MNMPFETIALDYDDDVCIVKLNRGVTNPINPKLVSELSIILNDLKLDPEILSIVLTSNNQKMFSLGLDIPELYALSREEFYVFLRSFDRMCLDLFSIPKATVTAIPGHAIAGGCILALCSDYHFISSGRALMGVNEVKLGVPVPEPAHSIIQDLVGSRIARELCESGDFHPPEALLTMGLVDRICDPGDLLVEAIEKARKLGSLPQDAYRMIKRNRTDPVIGRVLPSLQAKEDYFMDCWFSEPVRENLREAMKKF